MKFKKLLLPATLAIGYASFSQPGLRKTSSTDMLTGDLVKYEFATSRVDFSGNRKINTLLEEKISINMNDATLNKILREVRRQTGLQFIAQPNALNFSRKVNIHLNDVTLEQIMAFIERAFSVRCFIHDETIIVKLKTFVYTRIYCQVVDSASQPVPKAFVTVKGIDKLHECNQQGVAFLEHVTGTDTLVIFATGWSYQETPVESEKMKIVLHKKPGTMPLFQRTLKNGITEQPEATSAGSYFETNMESFQNRNQSPNIVTRLQATNSIPFPTYNDILSGVTAGSPRGLNTLTANRRSLYIVNEHAQDVDSHVFNPFDIQSVHQIKDADATALWGSRSGNSINNFEIKRGLTAGCNVNFLSSRTITAKPNPHYQQGLNAVSRIDLEQQAFKKKQIMAWSPVYGALLKTDPATIDAVVKDLLLEYGSNDLKKDLQNTAYQSAELEQYALSVQTGTPKVQVYASVGIDDQKQVEKGDRWRRITGLVNTTFQSGDWEAQVTANVANINTWQNFVKTPTNLPYLSLFDNAGNAKALPILPAKTDTNFLDDKYIYQDEAKLADHTIRQFYQGYTAKLSYQSPFDLKGTVNYQLSHINYTDINNHVLASYYTRTLVNNFRQNDSGNISWPIPPGDITDKVTMETFIHSLRAQLDYSRKFKKYDLSLLAGAELRSYDMKGHAIRNYASNLSFYPTPIDYVTRFNLTSSQGGSSRILYINNPIDSANNLIGHYASGNITYLEKYSISLSTRNDFMNRYSSSQNKKGLGMWAAGAAWYISNEKFYKGKKIFSDLKFRFTVGRTGNVDYSIPPFNSIQSTVNQGLVYNYAVPSTRQITWEKLFMLNAGLDFASKFIKGSVDVYRKKGWDLLQDRAWNPTTGTGMVKSNSGSLKGGGLEVALQTERLTIAGDLKCSVTFLLAHTTNKVTSDDGLKRQAQEYTNAGIFIPRKGYPVESIFAYPYGGLSAEGKPRGYLNKGLSENYDSIFITKDGSTLQYMGSATPTTVATITPGIHYKSFTLSSLFILKTGFSVRTQALNYQKLLQQTGGDAPGYELRWQNPGEETQTDIPALLFPIDISAMQFYEGSTAHVINGSHLRLQDIQLGYQIDNKKYKKFPFKKLEAFVTVGNVGIVWRANKKGIDPDVPAGWYPQPRSLSLTLKLTY